jgi:serine/threonine protein kinase
MRVECAAYPAVDVLSPGTRIGRYEVVKLLAMGGMAEIYLAKNVGLQGFETLSVLKRLPPSCLDDNPSYVNLFFDEARLVASLRHPNIAQVFDFGQHQDSYFFVMEYLDGVNLRQLIQKGKKRGERVPLACAIQIMLGVTQGLHAAHEARGPEGQSLDIVHRDVSPTNVVVTNDGAVKVIDFGVAKSTKHRARTETGVVKGKFAYMSPEQCRAKSVDRRTDLFALGVVLYELTTGSRPHGASCGPDLIHSIVEKDCPDPRLGFVDYPEELAEIVGKLLDRNPERRYQTAREVHQALSLFAARRQMMLSPYELASWVNGLTQAKAAQKPKADSKVPTVRLMQPISIPKTSNRESTKPFTKDVARELLMDVYPKNGSFAEGTGPLNDIPVAPKAIRDRMQSIAYADLEVSDKSFLDEDYLEFADEDLLEDEDFDVITEPASAISVRQEKPRSLKRSLMVVLCATMCLGSVVSAAALVGYLRMTGTDLSELVDFVRQLV